MDMVRYIGRLRPFAAIGLRARSKVEKLQDAVMISRLCRRRRQEWNTQQLDWQPLPLQAWESEEEAHVIDHSSCCFQASTFHKSSSFSLLPSTSHPLHLSSSTPTSSFITTI